MFTAMLILSMGLSGIPEAPVAAWEFNSPGEVQPWRANSHMSMSGRERHPGMRHH